jgi:hypothetical protein
MITAWLDDEMSPRERRDFEAAVSASPELGMRVARLSRIERMLAPAFAETLNEPIPDRFDAILRRRPAFSLDGMRAFLSDMFTVRQAGMVAASLVVGVVVGGVLLARSAGGPGLEPANGAFAANGDMAVKLASLQSGQGGEGFNIRLSLIDDSGRYCRQFETASATGLACRDGDNWTIDTLSTTVHAAADGAYVMADGTADPAIAAAMVRRGVKQVLDQAEEAAAIKAGWKTAAE